MITSGTKVDQDRVSAILKETVTLLCKNGLTFQNNMKVQGLLGITIDENNVFIVHLNETFGGTIQSLDTEVVVLNPTKETRQSGEAPPSSSGIFPAGRQSPSCRKCRRKCLETESSSPSVNSNEQEPIDLDPDTTVKKEAGVSDKVYKELEILGTFSTCSDDKSTVNACSTPFLQQNDTDSVMNETVATFTRINHSSDVLRPKLDTTETTTVGNMTVKTKPYATGLVANMSGGNNQPMSIHELNPMPPNHNLQPLANTSKQQQGCMTDIPLVANVSTQEQGFMTEKSPPCTISRQSGENLLGEKDSCSIQPHSKADTHFDSNEAHISLRPQDNHIDRHVPLAPQGSRAPPSQSRTDEVKSTKTGPFSCPYPNCSNTYQYKFCVNRHMKVHTPKVIKCPVCRKVFTDEGMLELHKKNAHESGKWPCTDCTQVYHSKSELNSYLKYHWNIYAYSCSQCAKQFQYKSKYDSHMAKHNGIKQYTCKKCNKQFGRSFHLTKHIKICKSIKKQCTCTCSMCDAQFSSKRYLREHLIDKHVQPDRYQCPICGQKFSHRGSLFSHKKRKH